MRGDRLKAEKGAGENIEATSEIINACGFKTKKVPPVSVTKCAEKIVGPYDDGWPEYEEPFVDVQTL